MRRSFAALFATAVTMVLSYAWQLLQMWLRGAVDTPNADHWGPWTSTTDAATLRSLAAVGPEFHALVRGRH